MDKEKETARLELNKLWEQRIKDCGADFVYFVDISIFPSDIIEDYSCAVLFGKALSKDYIRDRDNALEFLYNRE